MSTRDALKPLILPVFIPTLAHSTGTTAILPVIPLIALHLGFSVAQAAALTMIGGILGVLGPVPVGRLMSRVGARAAMIVTGVIQIGMNVAGFWLVATSDAQASDRWGFIGILTMMGITDQVWLLGRQSYLGTHLPPQHRARGMSTFGGTFRIGQILGPAIGGAAIAAGDLQWVFAVHGAGMTIAVLLVTFGMLPGDEAQRQADRPADRSDRVPVDLVKILKTGAAVVPLTIGRLARPLILPLLGAEMGLDASTISFIFAIGAALEIIMFAPAGVMMDRYGRTAVLLPCLVFTGLGYLVLTILVWTVPTGHEVAVLVIGTIAIALGNGFGAGIVMTIGIDISPEVGRTRHLAAWNAVNGTGRLLAPALVSAVTAVATLATSGLVIGLLALLASGWAVRIIPQVTPRPTRGPFARGR